MSTPSCLNSSYKFHKMIFTYCIIWYIGPWRTTMSRTCRYTRAGTHWVTGDIIGFVGPVRLVNTSTVVIRWVVLSPGRGVRSHIWLLCRLWHWLSWLSTEWTYWGFGCQEKKENREFLRIQFTESFCFTVYFIYEACLSSTPHLFDLFSYQTVDSIPIACLDQSKV